MAESFPRDQRAQSIITAQNLNKAGWEDTARQFTWLERTARCERGWLDYNRIPV
jgi:hypothetical protein